MEAMLDQVQVWFEGDRSAALATVIRTWGSSPRPAGAAMAVSDQSEIIGSVSGGCVEGAVIEAALGVIQDGDPIRLHFGVADQDAWEVGLSCGGEIEVFVRPFMPVQLQAWRKACQQPGRICQLLVVAGSPDQLGKEWFITENGEEFPDKLPAALRQAALKAIQAGETGIIPFPEEPFEEVFLEVRHPPRTLILVGGAHIAIPLTSLAQTLGFEVVIIDPRRLFTSEARFPEVSRLLTEWPQEAFQQITLTASCAVVMLTHDPKIDDPAIMAVIDSPAFYIGALGSRKTHQKRIQRLVKAGLDPSQLERIHAPVGLDLGGSSPEEIALAVIAEIVKEWHDQKA